MKNNLKLETKYKTKALFDGISSNNDILIYFYLPIIGNDAYVFYSFLLLESKNNALNTIFIPIDRVIDLLNFSLEKIELIISRLEMVNLINVMIDKKNRIIFCLEKPLTAKEFYNSYQLKEILLSKIGKKNIEINSKIFNSLYPIKNDDFKLITKKAEINVNVDGLQESGLNVDFDFNLIKSIIVAKGIDWSLFWSSELEKELINLLIIYKISSFDIATELINEFANKSFNKDNLINTIKKNYRKKGKSSDIIINNERKLDYLKDMSIQDFFNKKLDRNLTSSELEFISKLKNDYNFSDYFIIILIDYSIIVNDGAINKNYIKKISNTILKEGINTPELLIKHLKVSYKLKKNGKTKSNLLNDKLLKEQPIFK